MIDLLEPTDDLSLTQTSTQAKADIITCLNGTPDVVLHNGRASTRQLSNQSENIQMGSSILDNTTNNGTTLGEPS